MLGGDENFEEIKPGKLGEGSGSCKFGFLRKASLRRGHLCKDLTEVKEGDPEASCCKRRERCVQSP